MVVALLQALMGLATAEHPDRILAQTEPRGTAIVGLQMAGLQMALA
jgi:hypothetical protein